MVAAIHLGDCVKLPDGRVARVREHAHDQYRVRVRRKTSNSHQFLEFSASDLVKVDCPKGWMSPDGYNRYLQKTLAKAHERAAAKP
ncbi:MAG TPA: hypothetical protein VIU62_01310 [Chloroflexota bacterium]